MQTGQDVAWLFIGNASLELDVFLFILEFITCIITVKNAGKVCVDIGLRVVCVLLCSQVSSDLDMYVCACSCRPVYVSAVRPQSKHIVVMVDHGASVTDTQLQIARDSALVILNAIDEHDKVSEREYV